MQWPIYKKELLEIGNLESNTGLCTLWTPREKVLEHVSPENFLVAGQCYSKCEGPSLIIRHALANKKLTRIIICGVDLNNTGNILIAIKERGVDPETKKVIGFSDAEIESEIPIEAIERFRQNVEIIDKREIKDYSLLNDFLSSLQRNESWGESEVYDRPPPKSPEFYPSEKTAFVVRGKKVGDVWLEILDTIRKFGHIKKSNYSDDQQEIACLVSVVTDEDPENMDWKPWFNFTKEHFQKYLPQLMSSELIGDVTYTYGSRLRNFKGINQIDFIVNQLKKQIYSRKAIGVLWDVETDTTAAHGPCIDIVQALGQEKLHMTVYIRSNDMFRAWPENALALRKVHHEIAKKVEVPLGDLIIISNSAHIYSSNWGDVAKMLEENPIKLRKDSDSRGNILVDIEENKIKITHLTPEGKRIQEFYAENAKEAYIKIYENKMISQISHALDIGVELSKAELALKTGKKYIQDKDFFL